MSETRMTSLSVQQHYAENAHRYDLLMRPFARLRTQAIASLGLSPGATVLELGCGTGTSFPALLAVIGPHGHLIGVDRSAEMLRYAQHKIAQLGGENVQLLCLEVDQLAVPPGSVDAVFAFYTNDIFSSAKAIQHGVHALRLGGRFVIAGAKLTRGWRGVVLNAITRSYASRSIITPLTERPWQPLAGLLNGLTVQEYLGGSAFIAVGVKLPVSA